MCKHPLPWSVGICIIGGTGVIVIIIFRIASLLSKPHITVHQAKELLQLAKDVKCTNINLYNDYIGAVSSHGDPHVVIEAIHDMEKNVCV